MNEKYFDLIHLTENNNDLIREAAFEIKHILMEQSIDTDVALEIWKQFGVIEYYTRCSDCINTEITNIFNGLLDEKDTD